ncbi:MAG: polysaccharide pyruvyl transferase CsaB [Candidatus Eremiobacteraeota bacterium]|nr:polysaccharide pyruvyl transferase CsaB [Candidatus Eremiobacteraeota bacterium]
MRFLLSGYYGFDNLGDEALLEVIIAQIRTRHPFAEIDVLSEQPEVTAHRFRVDATPRMDMGRVREAIARADVVLSGGGGLLQNATSLKSLMYYAGIIRAAVRAKRRTMIFGQSIGPLDFFGRTIVREWCRGVSAATVRDGRSQKLLSSLLPHIPVEQTADPVFLYDAPVEDANLTLEGLGEGSDPLIVVCVRKAANFVDGAVVVARAVDRLSEQHNAQVAFLPLGGVDDAEVSTIIIRKCKSHPVLLPECTLARAATIIARSHAVIGMRLHALILAARYGVPFLAIPYDPKVAALCEDLAYPLAPLWTPEQRGKPPEKETDMLCDQLVSQRRSLSKHLQSQAERLTSLARRNFDVLDELCAVQSR